MINGRYEDPWETITKDFTISIVEYQNCMPYIGWDPAFDNWIDYMDTSGGSWTKFWYTGNTISVTAAVCNFTEIVLVYDNNDTVV